MLYSLPDEAAALLVRHGRTHENDDRGRYSDNPEGSPLNATGRAQAWRLAGFMRAIGFVSAVALSSPVPRATETACLLLEQTGATARVHPLQQLGPQRWGDVEIPGRRELMRTWSYPLGVLDSRFPGGESGWEVYARISPVAELVKSLVCERRRNVLVVSHGLVLRLLMARLLGHDRRTIETNENPPPGCGALVAAGPSGGVSWTLSAWTAQLHAARWRGSHAFPPRFDCRSVTLRDPADPDD